MLQSSGEIGQVVNVRDDGYLCIVIDQTYLTFNSLAVVRVNFSGISQSILTDMLKSLSEAHSECVHNDLLCSIAIGDAKRVQQLLHVPDTELNCLVGVAGQQTTFVQAASQHGQTEILKVCTAMFVFSFS